MNAQEKGAGDRHNNGEVVERDGRGQPENEFGGEVGLDECFMQVAGFDAECFSIGAAADVIIGQSGKVQGEKILRGWMSPMRWGGRGKAGGGGLGRTWKIRLEMTRALSTRETSVMVPMDLRGNVRMNREGRL